MSNNGNGFDILNIASFILGYENLIENRQQSQQNDVSAANEKQASYLLNEIGKRLDKQDSILNELTIKVEEIFKMLNSNER